MISFFATGQVYPLVLIVAGVGVSAEDSESNAAVSELDDPVVMCSASPSGPKTVSVLRPIDLPQDWVSPTPKSVDENRFVVIDDEGGVVDVWRLRQSIARFARGEGERIDLATLRQRITAAASEK